MAFGRLPGGKAWRGVVIALTLAAFVPPAAPAGAVLSGENGRIVFASGRDGGDAIAGIYLLPVPSSTGGGTVSPVVASGSGTQFRHPTWSPDRTRIAYAAGIPGSPTTELFDIFIQDLETNEVTPITDAGDGLSADRPAWSPDGTRIAYEHQPIDNSAERDIRVQTVGSAAPPLDLTSGAPVEGKPAWSPDSQQIYYHRVGFFNDLDIVKEAADGSSQVFDVQAASGIDEFQASISPDGTAMCFTLQSPPGSTSGADVFTTQFANPGIINDLSDNPASADYNCTWSPDGQFIAYVQGAFSAGALLMERADDTSPSPITLTDSAGTFDGNPDWAPDGRPECPDSKVTTSVNTPVTISMDCTDTGPAYEQTPVKESIAFGGEPSSGTIGQVSFGDPSTVTYTPGEDFTGKDSLRFVGFDDFGFGTDRGSVVIRVRKSVGAGGKVCGGQAATIVGTSGDDTLVGLDLPDVIVGLGGNDVVRGGSADDILCGGRGRDKIKGNKGADLMIGGPGVDRCVGGPGRDRVRRCERP